MHTPSHVHAPSRPSSDKEKAGTVVDSLRNVGGARESYRPLSVNSPEEEGKHWSGRNLSRGPRGGEHLSGTHRGKL